MNLLHNATIIDSGKRFRGYLAFENEYITHVGCGNVPQALVEIAGSNIADMQGAYIIPGVIDDQVHFRDPGLTHKGDIATESAAAAAGGVTSFMDMPNTNPSTTTVADLERKLDRANAVSTVNYSFFLGATNSNIDELLKADYTRIPGVKLFLGSSTGNMLVDNECALNEIFSKVPALVAIHSEDEQTICRNREAAVEKYAPSEPPVTEHPVIRSREACVTSTVRAIARARKYGTRLHVLHVSTADEAELFDPGHVSGKRITAEVTVQHLWFSDEDYHTLGTRIKMNPAVKTASDRDALRQALRDGRIDIVATDHAPHLLSEKQGGAVTAASGAPMVQFSLPLMLEMADKGIFTHELVVEKMCNAPAELYGICKRGFLREGYYADFVVVRPDTPYTVTDADALSRCGWTPLCGTTLHNRVEAVWVNGCQVYSLSTGVVPDTGASMPLYFEKQG
ncbi:dihydroorotase [uncultured Muribaculum sp.]|uniref:dihydroorotase n=1 Tax=uncultured Muribaculum sp. TaxID=1918613 RepID=UPI002674AF14|nr:dihydroorotase [uncultured Muribaculum sp.]